MALPGRRSKNPKTLAFLLVGMTFVVLHQWFLQEPTQKYTEVPTAAPWSSAAAVQLSPHLQAPPCVANASVNLTEGFQELPARIQDFLRYRHCRRFPQLWDSPHKCAGHRGVFLLLAVKSSPAHYERRELIRRTCDDDVFVHTANVVHFLEVQSPESHLFTGQLMDGSVPIRESWSKYFVPPQLFPGKAYPVYCSGGGFLLSSRTARDLLSAARQVPLFPIDDAYMGMCLKQAGLAPSPHEGIRPFGVRMPGAKRSSFDPCVYRELLLVHRFAPYEMLLMWKALHNPQLHCSRRHQAGPPENRKLGS
ncbi:Acetylgalactosaminyl-O-glycosyl-glycoprotein beta-1,3-N-acetylglucosaminyltransferase [Microtus ochrogaster]|uniref:Hexosyltransferase n=1 Tax=Microtus ochrogaster TaxID=79684 RepID=A0A8J6KXA9_MICOH|nr:Acetylgalactosaminyl-O-glycosyl-glycoprotein beta-1,3-N-acetylglucosaminyltransferase [Microtus ochrogaster]